MPTLIYTNGMPILIYTSGRLTLIYTSGRPTLIYTNGRPTLIYTSGQLTFIYTNGRPSVHIVLHFILLAMQQTTAPGLCGTKVSNFIIGWSCHKYHLFVATKHVFCRDKSILAAVKLLSRQNIFEGQIRVCRDKNDTCGRFCQ